MTMTEQLVSVEQVDREAAAGYISNDGLRYRTAQDMAFGRHDGNRLVQAFARHRLDAIAAIGKERDGLREALKPFALAADDLDDQHGERSDIWEAPAAMSITAGNLRAARAALGEGEKA